MPLKERKYLLAKVETSERELVAAAAQREQRNAALRKRLN